MLQEKLSRESRSDTFDEVQLVQENQYNFPYHYVSQFRKGFRCAFYDSYGLRYVSSMELILNKLKEEKFDNICDIGCGDGRLIRELNRDFIGKKIVGIDYSERTINLARGLNPSLDFRQINIMEDSLDASFDMATLIEVFEHIPPDLCPGFVKGIYRLLKPGGKLIVTVPHTNIKVSEKHYRHFTSETLQADFQDYFEVQEVLFLERRRNWRSYLHKRLLKNKLFLLNNKFLLNWIFKSYRKHNLIVNSEKECERLYMMMTRR